MRLFARAALALFLLASPVPALAQAGGTTNHPSAPSLATSLIALPNEGMLASFNCTAITGGAAGYCVAYDSATVPSPGALTGASVRDVCYFSGTAGCSLTHMPFLAAFNNGIVILVTTASSPFTYTTGTDTAFISADVQ